MYDKESVKYPAFPFSFCDGHNVPSMRLTGRPFQLEAESKDLDRMRAQNAVPITIRSCTIPVSSFHPAVHPSELRTPLQAT
jgi:hypothetical protein